MCRTVCFLCLAALALLPASISEAALILMVGPSPSGLFTDGGLAQYGHTVTIGPNYDQLYTSPQTTFDLSVYDVIFLSAVVYNLPDMSLQGQQAIVDFVNNGGGLITGAWTTANAGLGNLSFQLLHPLFPAQSNGYIGGAGMEVSVRYAQETLDPILNAGLPTSMDVIVNGAGSELLDPKPGSTVFYSGDSISPWYNWWTGPDVFPVDEVFPSGGLVGWDYGLGRVMNFSTTLGNPTGPDYTDNFSRLIANSASWAAARGSAVPEPASLTLLVLGGLGATGARLRRRFTTPQRQAA